MVWGGSSGARGLVRRKQLGRACCQPRERAPGGFVVLLRLLHARQQRVALLHAMGGEGQWDSGVRTRAAAWRRRPLGRMRADQLDAACSICCAAPRAEGERSACMPCCVAADALRRGTLQTRLVAMATAPSQIRN